MPKYISFFVLHFVYIHHSHPFLKLAAPGQSVIVQDSLCPYLCGVMLLLDLAQPWLLSRFEHSSIIVCSIGMCPIFSNHLGQYRFTTSYTNGCTKGDERSGTIVSLSSLWSFAVTCFVERL
jgi:hypothetical protein